MGSGNRNSGTDCRGTPSIRTPALDEVDTANINHQKRRHTRHRCHSDTANKQTSPACPINIAFGEILKRLRHQQALSLIALAHRSDVDPTRLTQMDQGELTPTVTELVHLAIALNVNPSALLRCLDTSDPPA